MRLMLLERSTRLGLLNIGNPYFEQTLSQLEGEITILTKTNAIKELFNFIFHPDVIKS